MKKYIKYMLIPFDNASRNKRELSVISLFDCEIIVFDIGDRECQKIVDGYVVYQKAKNLSKNPLVRIFQIAYIVGVKYPRNLRKERPNCISCHDLIALFIGWLSTWFVPKNRKPQLVYDSHEFEIERNTGGKRSILTKFIITKLEKFLIKKCAFSIMVNDTIADEVQRIHKLKQRPIVVRNIPNYWVIDRSICDSKKIEYCKTLGMPNDTFIVMYHGIITKNRGLETILKAVSMHDKIAAVILGNGELNYVEYLKRMTMDLQISDRVLFHKAVPIDILWQYVGAADVGMIIPPNICKSYYYSLPNKLFENIQSLTPVITSNFPEIGRIVTGYDIGLIVNSENIDEIVSTIEKIRIEKEMYYKFKKNLERAKEELCWENECKVLQEAYGEIFKVR